MFTVCNINYKFQNIRLKKIVGLKPILTLMKDILNRVEYN